MKATEFLKAPEKRPVGPIAVLFGVERFLKQESLHTVTRLVLGPDADELAVSRVSGLAPDGRTVVDLKVVLDPLLTVSMWNPRQVVVVEDADEFVSAHRESLERYLERPSKKSVLVLDVKSWPSTTRLAKKTESIGLPLDCGSLKGAELFTLLADLSKQRHGKKLDREAAAQLVELAGTGLGLLDQELAKLAAYVGARPAITVEDVDKMVGGWKAETTWTMLNAVRDGRLETALLLLDKLIRAGEHPLKLLGGVNFVYRPAATAVQYHRDGLSLEEGLAKAGAKPFAIKELCASLRRMGQPRAARIGNWLLQADLGVKGASTLPERVLLERLLVQLAGKS
jgi:DNA polymerase III subunit delta